MLRFGSRFASRFGIKGSITAGMVLSSLVVLAASAGAQEGSVETTAVVTVMPRSGQQIQVPDAKSFKVTVNYKAAAVTTVVPLRGDRGGLELVVLIDDSAQRQLAEQLPDLRSFVQSLPGETWVGVAYMQNGRAVMVQGPTRDHGVAARALRMPQGSAGSNASPYFCLSALTKAWPSISPDNRREVLMITDGNDPYGGASFDPSDTYVTAAIADAQRARVVVDSLFYRNQGGGEDGRGSRLGGQDYLQMVSSQTGGKSYYQMTGNPVSFSPYLDDLHGRLMNQYELGFIAQAKGRAELQSFKVKASIRGALVNAPEKVLVGVRQGR